ncbi:MAG: winged helix-turn-helix domain-containing protein [Ktedonobacterales bacterium]
MLARHIHLQPHLTIHELEDFYRKAYDPIERGRWHFLWLLSRGFTATTIASVTGYSSYWIGQMARRYNREGPDGVRDRRHRPKAATPLLSQDREQELRNALAGPAPGGDLWCGRTVAAWIGQHLRRHIPRQTGWRWLRRLGATWRKPRPRHVGADPAAQRAFKDRHRPRQAAGGSRIPSQQGGRRLSNSAAAVISSGRRRCSPGGLSAFTAGMVRIVDLRDFRHLARRHRIIDRYEGRQTTPFPPGDPPRYWSAQRSSGYCCAASAQFLGCPGWWGNLIQYERLHITGVRRRAVY